MIKNSLLIISLVVIFVLGFMYLKGNDKALTFIPKANLAEAGTCKPNGASCFLSSQCCQPARCDGFQCNFCWKSGTQARYYQQNYCCSKQVVNCTGGNAADVWCKCK